MVYVPAGVLAVLKISQLDEEGIADRGYRLYYNAGQNRADAFARVGRQGLGGVALAAAAAAAAAAACAAIILYDGSILQSART
jgi:hypothetical protein